MENELEQVLQFVLFNKEIPLKFSSEDKLIKELWQQTMLSVLGPSLKKLPFSEQKQAYCIKYVAKTLAHTHKLLYEQNLLVDLFDKNHIQMAILKGCAAAINYPEPLYRAFGDVDFIVREDDFSKAYELMLANGYTLCVDEDNVDYHYTLQKDNIVFELHKNPAGMPEGEQGLYLKEILNNGLNAVETVEIDGYQVPVLPTISNGIVLLLHIKKHLSGGLGLRQITDWMMFVDKHLDDSAWKSDFKEILFKSGLETLSKTVTKMCQLHLGLRQEITWCNDASDNLCSELWKYVLDKGNFGRKEGYKDKGKNIAQQQIKNPFVLLKKLQRDGLRDWEKCRKYSFLKPFAWLRQLVYYITYAFQHRKHIASDVKIGNARARMIDQLIEKH